MFNNMTLYPGGAFVVCESVGEFDPNVPAPAPAVIPSDWRLEDPVIKTISKLQPVYDQCIGSLLNMDYSYRSSEDAIVQLERIRVALDKSVNTLVQHIAKMNGLLTVCNSRSLFFETEFYQHLGLFMKHASDVERLGYIQYEYESRSGGGINQLYDISSMVQAMASTPAVLDSMLVGNMWETLFADGERSMARSYESMHDLLKCVFTDVDRLMRQERRAINRVRFPMLLQCGHDDESVFSVCAENPSTTVRIMKQLFSLMSRTLKSTSMEIYDLKCKIMDGTITPEVYMDRVRPMMLRTLNLFGAGVVVALNIAYELRRAQDWHKAVNAYSTQLVQVLENPG